MEVGGMKIERCLPLEVLVWTVAEVVYSILGGMGEKRRGSWRVPLFVAGVLTSRINEYNEQQ